LLFYQSWAILDPLVIHFWAESGVHERPKTSTLGHFDLKTSDHTELGSIVAH